MDFREAEESFQELKRKLDEGSINQEEFRAQLAQLRVQDGQGRTWMIGVQSGKWYFYDGSRWVQAEPPREAEVRPPRPRPEEEPLLARAPWGPEVRPPSPSPLSLKVGPSRRADTTRLVVAALVGVAFLCCLSLASLGIVEFLLPGRPVTSTLNDLLGREISPLATLTPTPESTTATPMSTPAISAQELMTQGDQLVSAGQLEEALVVYKQAVEIEPQNSQAHLKLAQTYLALERCTEAIPEFQQALMLDPELAEAQEGLQECAGPPPPQVTFTSYSRVDLGFTILYPSSWLLDDQESRTVFTESEEALESMSGNLFFIGSLPLTPEKAGMSDEEALQGIVPTLPPGTELGEIASASVGEEEWAAAYGEIKGEVVAAPMKMYAAAKVWHSRVYAFWAMAPTTVWEEEAWPLFEAMIETIKIKEVAPEATLTPLPATPTPTPEVVPTPTLTPTPTPTVAPTLSGRIAFTLFEGGTYETYVANIDGSGRQHIWSRMHQPDFDPSGGRLAANGELADHMDIQLIQINADNSAGQHRAISKHLEDSWPSWSPDGSKMAFVFNIGKRLLKILSDLSRPTEGDLIKGPGGINIQGASFPVWVGNRIAFTGCDYWGAGTACGIYTVPEGGGDAIRISEDSQDRATDGLGNQLLYMSAADGDWEIWKVSSIGTGQQRLTDNSAQDGLATWSPDGKQVAFLTNQGGAWEIWVMNADGTDPHPLFALAGDPGPGWTEERLSWGPK